MTRGSWELNKRIILDINLCLNVSKFFLFFMIISNYGDISVEDLLSFALKLLSFNVRGEMVEPFCSLMQ